MTTSLIGNLCQECENGYLRAASGPGRAVEVKHGLRVELPLDLEVPTCDACGEMSFDSRLLRELDQLAHAKVIASQKEHAAFLVEQIKVETHCTQRDIELACGVTPTYLSHVLAGRKEASEVLIGLLESFAVYPEELTRRKGRSSCFDTESVRMAIAARKRQVHALGLFEVSLSKARAARLASVIAGTAERRLSQSLALTAHDQLHSVAEENEHWFTSPGPKASKKGVASIVHWVLELKQSSSWTSPSSPAAQRTEEEFDARACA